MASPKKDLLEFEKAIEYMDPVQVTDYLYKTLDFLKRNNNELFFPNISSYTEAFLVRLVSETKHLKSKSLNLVNKKVAAEIIEVLETNRDVFRWTYGYENGKLSKNLLVYKKIYTNKLKMKPAQLPTSTLAQRLAKAQSLTEAPGSKTQLLNTTLRFLKSDSERTLVYPEMPLSQAQYIYSLIKHPESELSVGFGYKSLCAPLFQALEECGADYVFEITFLETNSCETASIKLEKKPRKITQDSKKEGSSLNSSVSSATRSRKKPLIDGVAASFISRTLKRLLNFTAASEMASVKFENLSEEELAFIKGVKSLAASTESHGQFEPHTREALRQLHCNIVEVLKTCRLRVEEGLTRKSKARFLTVKKVPRDKTPPDATERITPPVTRSKSAVSVKSRDRSRSKERRIQFESAGKLNPTATTDNTNVSAIDKPTTDKSTTDKSTTDKSTTVKPTTDKPTTDNATTDSNKKDRGRSTERLNSRKAKLLEDMSVPLESDRGIRMMLLMGWNGGALGARGEGILEPIVPSIELPPGAGLGHVPPPKPEKARGAADFRASLLQNILELFQRNLDSKEVEYKTPLNKKEKSFLTSSLKCLNKRAALGLSVKAEVEMCKQIMQAMTTDTEVVLAAEVSKDLKKITLTKTRNPSEKSLAKIITKLNKQAIKDAPITMTVLNTHLEYEVIDEDAINTVIQDVIPKIRTTCKTPIAIKTKAIRILFMQRFTLAVKGEVMEKEFRYSGSLPKRLVAFIDDVVLSVNCRVRSTYVTPDEMGLYDELAQCAEGWQLSVKFVSASILIFSKTPSRREYQKRFYNSAWPHAQDNNNDKQTNNQNQDQPKNGWASAENDEDANEDVSKDNHDIVVRVDEKEREALVGAKDDAKTETECDIENKENQVNVTNVNNEETAVKRVTAETDDEMSNDSLCVCDTSVDISELDKDIQELELAISDFKFKVKKECDAKSPNSKRSRSNSANSEEMSTKRSKISKNNLVIISPNDPKRKINTDIIKSVQTCISQGVDKCTHFLPQLTCHGVQRVGLIYSCHDSKTVDWLKTVIDDADLDLKVSKSVNDICIEQKSRKMVIKINSFIPLESKTVFKRLEMYNNGLLTELWKVLAEQTYNCYVLLIVEVDENSFRYISKEDFSLHIGTDKAQFSVIF